MKNNPMSAFVKAGFDVMGYCNHDFHSDILVKHVDELDDDSKSFVPRPNKPQVLDDYTPILVEGFVWNIKCSKIKSNETHRFSTHEVTSDEILGLLDDGGQPIMKITSIAFKGIQRGYGLSEWAKANDVPIYSDKMEVVV